MDERWDRDVFAAPELPDTAESDSSAVPAEGVVEEPKADKGAMPAAAGSKPEAKAEAADDGDEGSDEEIPKDLEKLTRALKGARGDGRKYRKQWQEVEREKARLEGQLAALRQQPQAQEKRDEQPAPKFWDGDPEQFIDARLQNSEQRLLQHLQNQEIERERRWMLRTHKDFAEAERTFLKAAETNPSLKSAAWQSGDPVGYAYEHGKQMQRLEKYEASTIDELEAKIREQVRAEILAEQAGNGQQAEPVTRQAPAKPPIPKSLAGVRGNGVGVTREWSGPRPFDDLWGKT